MNQKESESNAILFVSTFPPRECGIATFTQDLANAVDKHFSPTLKSKVLALNKNGSNIYNYPKKVIHQISDSDINAYIETAKKINRSKNIKLVSIQHEFGIFGGDYGDHLLAFLEVLKKPSIVTFHSVIPHPDSQRKVVVNAIANKVKAIVVMTKTAIDILRNDYGIKTEIKLIPHGIPDVTFESQEKEKQLLGLKDKIVLSSFGMISCNKGYEYVIQALPEVVKQFPNLIYLIIGETHPVVRKEEGEEYRNMLEKKAKELNLEKNVKFYNKYLTKKEIISYLKASDIYISPSLTPEQITSGTLVYAMSCGRAIISTPFLHAKDILTEDKGRLAEFKKPASFTSAITSLLSDNTLLKQLEQNSYAYTRQMTWQNVAISYAKLFNKYLEVPEIYFTQIPRINTYHLNRLTDEFGIIQFANYAKPDINSGYTLDDNSRALIVACQLHEKSKSKNNINLIKTYLEYIKYVQQADGRLYNFVDKDKKIDFNTWSEEAHARAIRSLGYVISTKSLPPEIRSEAESIFLKALEITPKIHHQRAIASIIAGLYYYNREKYSEKNIELIKTLADSLVSLYNENSNPDWKWFEKIMTYSNAKLPEALMFAYIATQDKKYLPIAKDSLDFLIRKTFQKETFVPIGQDGWYDSETNKRALFDQQPIEAASMTNSLILAYKIFQDSIYQKLAISAFNWFLGKNLINKNVYNEQTGGCHDGLGHEVINMNQGAESTISYLLARLSLSELK